jgi:hypothetical protein
MVRSFISLMLLICGVGLVASTGTYAQGSKPLPDSKKISVCGISFLAPANLKNSNERGIDSCVASFSSNDIDLHIDYGWYGGPSTKYETYTDFKKEAINIDGKKGQFATYKDTRMDVSRNLVARLFVAVSLSPIGSKIGGGMTTSLNMTMAANGEKDLKTARQIFRSIRFDK